MADRAAVTEAEDNRCRARTEMAATMEVAELARHRAEEESQRDEAVRLIMAEAVEARAKERSLAEEAVEVEADVKVRVAVK